LKSSTCHFVCRKLLILCRVLPSLYTLYFSHRKIGQWALWLCHFLVTMYLTNCNNNYYFSVLSDDIMHLPEYETTVHISWPTVTVCRVQGNTCYVCRTCLTMCMIVRPSPVFWVINYWKIFILCLSKYGNWILMVFISTHLVTIYGTVTNKMHYIAVCNFKIETLKLQHVFFLFYF